MNSRSGHPWWLGDIGFVRKTGNQNVEGEEEAKKLLSQWIEKENDTRYYIGRPFDTTEHLFRSLRVGTYVITNVKENELTFFKQCKSCAFWYVRSQQVRRKALPSSILHGSLRGLPWPPNTYGSLCSVLLDSNLTNKFDYSISDTYFAAYLFFKLKKYLQIRKIRKIYFTFLDFRLVMIVQNMYWPFKEIITVLTEIFVQIVRTTRYNNLKIFISKIVDYFPCTLIISCLFIRNIREWYGVFQQRAPSNLLLWANDTVCSRRSCS